MNVGIRNLMKGRVGERGYEGESLTGERTHSFGRRILDFGGEEAFWRGKGALVSWLGFSGSVGDFFRL
jgi:hypothetical protein